MTGMIGDVENAILARVAEAEAAGALGYKYRSRATWPKNFDDFLSKGTVQYPACWSVFGGIAKCERISRGRWRGEATFGLVVAAQNLRNEQATRQGGSASEPGAYQLAQDALGLLLDQRLGLDIDPLQPMGVELIQTADIPAAKNVAIYAVTFATALYFDATAFPADFAGFTRFHANWDPAPYGHVDPDALPDDAHAVGTDIIALPQENP